MTFDPTSVEATALRMLLGLRQLVEDRRPAAVIIEAIDTIADTIDPMRRRFRSQDVGDDEVTEFTIDLTTDPVTISAADGVTISAAAGVTIAPGVAVERICANCRHWRPGPNVNANGERIGTCVEPSSHVRLRLARDHCAHWAARRRCQTCLHWRHEGDASNGTCVAANPSLKTAPGFSCGSWTVAIR
jgi:hypothetical protein